jgi:hypothetical protein
MPEKVLQFEFEKATKNTNKYNEIPEAGQPPVVGTLYVQKWAARDAKRLTVKIELPDA